MALSSSGHGGSGHKPKKESLELQGQLLSDITPSSFETKFDKRDPKRQEDYQISEEMEGKIGLLLHAATRNNLPKVLALIRSGVPADAADYDKRTALHLAAAEGHAVAVKLLVEEGADMNFKDRFGHTPLDEAVRSGHQEVVDFLTERGAHYGALEDLEKDLIQAAGDGRLEDVVKILKAGGVSPNCCDYDARYPLHLAVANGNVAMVKFLLDQKADPTVMDRFGLTPLADAIRRSARVGRDPMRELFASFQPTSPTPTCSKFVFFFVLVQAALIVLFGLFVRYEETADGHESVNPYISLNNTGEGDVKVQRYIPSLDMYPFYQDVHVMIFIGFGYLMVFLRKHGYGSVGLTFLVAALTIQWYILCRGFWEGAFGGWKMIHVSVLDQLLTADFAAGAVLITFGVILGKVSPFQLLFLSLIETAFFSLNERISLKMGITDIGGTMVIHMFGAFFGMAVSITMTRRRRRIGASIFQGSTYQNSSASTRRILDKLKQDDTVEFSEQNTSDNSAVYHSDIFAMIGTIFLWLFWPSFNGAPGFAGTQHRAIINTLLSLTGSCVSAFLTSHALRHGKFNMVDIQNATLAGGVAMGTCANLVIYPASAIGIGAFAGFISVVGYAHIQKWLEEKIGLQDTCGVNNLHGMPSIIGAIAGIIASAQVTQDEYGSGDGSQLLQIYPNFATDGWTANKQALWQFCFILITIGIAVLTGLLTGLIARQRIFDPVDPKNTFLDEPHWEVPELELPYYFDHRGEVRRDDEKLPHLKKNARSFSNFKAEDFSRDQVSQPVMKDLRDKIAVLEAKQLELLKTTGQSNRYLEMTPMHHPSAFQFPQYSYPYPQYQPQLPPAPTTSTQYQPQSTTSTTNPIHRSTSGSHTPTTESRRFEAMFETILKKIDQLEKKDHEVSSPIEPRGSPLLKARQQPTIRDSMGEPKQIVEFHAPPRKGSFAVSEGPSGVKRPTSPTPEGSGTGKGRTGDK